MNVATHTHARDGEGLGMRPHTNTVEIVKAWEQGYTHTHTLEMVKV